MFKGLFKSKSETEQTKVETNTLESGEVFYSLGDDLNFKVIRNLSTDLMNEIEHSTLGVMSTQLYMHYWNANLKCKNDEDPAWKNQAIFFWIADEEFEKKSLPPEFETFDKKYFIVIDNPKDLSFFNGTVAPWFGMSGLGKKFYCKREDKEITIQELANIRTIEYVENTELSTKNVDILKKRDNYFFLVDERITKFKNNNFYIGEKIVPIGLAYSIGGIHIMRSYT